MACKNKDHFAGFQTQMQGIYDKGFGKEAKEILPKLGSDGLFELKNKKPLQVRQYKFCKMKCIALKWAPASDNPAMSNRIVCGDQSGQVLVINGKKGARQNGYNLSGPSKFVQSVAVHADKDLVVSGGMDNMVSLYGPEEGEAFLKNKKQWAGDGTDASAGHDGMISSLMWHPTEKNQFLSTGGDGEIKLWDISESKCLHTMYGHTQECGSITMPRDVPGGMTFATCSNDTTVRLWDLRTPGKCTLSLNAGAAADKLTSCDFFPNGNAIASGGQGQATYMWDIRSVKMIASFTRNNMKVTGCSFSKSGRALYVTHEDGRLIIWDTFGKQENQKYAVKFDAHVYPVDEKDPKSAPGPKSQITACLLKPDGEFLATSCFGGDICVWGALQAQA